MISSYEIESADADVFLLPDLYMKLQEFLRDENVTAGESLLEYSGISADKDLEFHGAFVTALIDVAELVIKINSNLKSVEIAVSIIANLVLHDKRVRIVLVERPSLLGDIVAICQSIDDPLMITVCFRLFTNIVYCSLGDILCYHCSILQSAISEIISNSLSEELLSQVFQFCYYIFTYDKSGNLLQSFIKVSWNPFAQCMDALSDELTVECLRDSKCSECSGFEWCFRLLEMILSCDKIFDVANEFIELDRLLELCLGFISPYPSTSHSTDSSSTSINLEDKISVITVLDLTFLFKRKDQTLPNKTEIYRTRIETLSRNSLSYRVILFTYVMESNLLGNLFDIWIETLLLQQAYVINNVASVVYNVVSICFLSEPNVLSTGNYESEEEETFIDTHKIICDSIGTTDEVGNTRIDSNNYEYINSDLMQWWPSSFTSFMDLFLDTSTKLWFKSERKNSGNLLFEDIGSCFTALIAVVKIYDSRKVSSISKPPTLIEPEFCELIIKKLIEAGLVVE
mmetsp:Transcript_30626/g.29244  ORF Transcript_30626/g.29244 Transcript_30626/m.29244 type:complete len:514 (+) Transcript_30626:62-1603(+)